MAESLLTKAQIDVMKKIAKGFAISDREIKIWKVLWENNLAEPGKGYLVPRLTPMGKRYLAEAIRNEEK